MTEHAVSDSHLAQGNKSDLSVIVLAAGEGKRMKSSLPKMLHPVAGRPLIGHVLTAVSALKPQSITVVVGHGREMVETYVSDNFPSAVCVVQPEQKGTGHAVQCVLDDESVKLAETVMVVGGDTPLIDLPTLTELLEHQLRTQAAAVVLTAVVGNPTGLGRIIRDPAGGLQEIVEHKDATVQQLAVSEVNSAQYIFQRDQLLEVIHNISTNNSQGECYLTDVIGLLRERNQIVDAYCASDPDTILGCNDRAELAILGRIMRDRIVTAWMRDGVTVIDPSSVWPDVSVTVEPDCVVEPQVYLRGDTHVSTGAVIGPDTTLINTTVASGAQVVRSHCIQATIGPGATVGPYSYLRPGTELENKAKVGAYVEVKNSHIGPGAKVPHLSYVGDTEVGEGTNIGAASITVNYDGVSKHRTVIGKHARIGSDTMLIAPVTIGDGAYTAAGSVITQDVPPGALGVGRSKQRIVDDWVLKRRPGTASAQAAQKQQDANIGEEDSPSP